MDTKIIAARIKEARELRGYTLENIASDIGVARSTIQRYENGHITKPKLPVIHAIANTLNVNPAWLSGYDVPMSKIPTDEEFNRDTNRIHNLGEAFRYLLASLEWEVNFVGDANYDPDDPEKNDADYCIFKNKDTSFKVNIDDYGNFLDDLEDFTKNRLQKLFLKATTELFSNDHLMVDAAHERTDIEASEEMKEYDDDIMNDDSEWE